MAEQSGLNDKINVFLDYFKLKEYDDVLRKAGLENLEIIRQLEDEDINEIINDINMKENDIETFKNAINLVKNGNYNPNESNKQEFEFEYRQIKYSNSNINDNSNNKTIIFIGESGVGKTMTINSMCNYLYNVKYDDRFRYKLIYENENKHDETQSQTQNINKYYLNQLENINYALTIIDTPGFGNTFNIENDTIIKKKFKKCFNEIEFIDAIYFVIKSTDGTRLSDAQKHIFNNIYKLFNDNIKNNIFILFTFSDGSAPPALKAISKTNIKYHSWFQINNSGFEAPKQQNNINNTHKTFFDLGLKQFDEIFDSLSKVQRQSVKELTENVPIVTVDNHKVSQNEYDNIENVDRGNNTCTCTPAVKVAIGCFVVVVGLICFFGIKYRNT